MTSRSHTIRIRIVLYNVLPESYSSLVLTCVPVSRE